MQGNQQQVQQKPPVQPYNGPKIVDASKDKPYYPQNIPPYNGPKIVDASKDIPYNQMQNQQKQFGRAPSEGRLKHEDPMAQLQRVYSDMNPNDNKNLPPDLKAKKPSSDNSKDPLRKPHPHPQPEVKKEVKPQNLDRYNWLDNKEPANKKEVAPYNANLELNKNRWVNKPINDPAKDLKVEPKQVVDINKNDFRAPPSHHANRERPLQKAAEREIFGGGGGFVAFYEAPKKDKKPVRQAVSEDKHKKKSDDKPSLKEKLAEDEKRRAEAEKAREQREREREEKRKQMLDDLKKKRVYSNLLLLKVLGSWKEWRQI